MLFSIFMVHFRPPDPDCESGSGSMGPTELGSGSTTLLEIVNLGLRGNKPGLHEPLPHEEGHKVPCRVALCILLDGGVAGGHVVEPGNAQLAQEPLPVLRTRRPHIVHGHHLLIAPWNLLISVTDPK